MSREPRRLPFTGAIVLLALCGSSALAQMPAEMPFGAYGEPLAAAEWNAGPLWPPGAGPACPIGHPCGSPAESLHIPMHERGIHPASRPALGGPHRFIFNQSGYSSTTGIRLDTSYRLVRETSGFSTINEEQVVSGGGVTILPYQSPCVIAGFRCLGEYVHHRTTSLDDGGLALDGYLGTRYKTLYLKGGLFWDRQRAHERVGATVGALTTFPCLGNLSIDAAFGFDPKGDVLTNLEVTDNDLQLRIGTFVTPHLQVGGTGRLLEFSRSRDEYGTGMFMNLYHGRWILGVDVTGGEEGARGFVHLAFSWGPHPANHPRDVEFDGIDTVGWLTRAVDRDLAIPIRRIGP